MVKQTGVHLYINITNLNHVIQHEESETGRVNHALHALDTFFRSIELFGKTHFPDSLVVEKITGSRLHLYFTAELPIAYSAAKTVAVYANRVASCINSEIPKYTSLLPFFINAGLAFGKFYEFEFRAEDNFTEMTTIGYAPNFAAKLQSITEPGCLSISENVYDALAPEEQGLYKAIKEASIAKYEQEQYFSTSLVGFQTRLNISDSDIDMIHEYAESIALRDIHFTGARKQISFQNISTVNGKMVHGIPVFADIRGFTSQFAEDDSNLEEMAVKTQNTLWTMYSVNKLQGGIHVQFQGDREVALYHDILQTDKDGYTVPEKRCFKSAVLAGMRLIDAVKPFSVHVGVGEDYGKLFAAKIGARGEKDNILLGETVIYADRMEDRYAGKDQLAITEAVYKGLKAEDASLAGMFEHIGSCFVTTIGYKDYIRRVSERQLQDNTRQHNYNGAWGGNH